MKIAYKGKIALLMALLELSFLPILLDIAGLSIGSVQLLFYVFLVAACISVPIAYFYDRKGLFALIKSKKNLAIIGVAGLCNNAISQLLLVIGTIGTNPSIGGIVFRTWVLMAALMIPFVLKTKVSLKQFAAILVGFAGLYMVVSNGTLLSINQQQLPYIAILLGCALSSAIAMLIIKSYNVSTTASVALFNVISVIFLGIIAVLFHISLSVQLSTQTISIILFLGIVTYGIGTTLYYYALKTLNPILVGNAVLTIPFITVLLSFFIVGTTIKAYYIYSAILIAAAVLAQQRFSKKAPERITNSLTKLQIFDITSAFVNNRKIMTNIKSDSRALAIKISASTKYDGYKTIFERKNILAFTNNTPHPYVDSQEVDFMNDIMAPQNDELILVGIGNANNVEEALEEFTKSQKTANKF